MIPISQIDSELSIYKENTVVIWGAGLYGKRVFDLLSSFRVKISAFCDMDEKKWGSTYEGIPVVSPEELKNMAEKEAVTVQSGLSAQHEASALEKLTELGVKNKISFDECYNILGFFQKMRFLEEFPHIKEFYSLSNKRPMKSANTAKAFYQYVFSHWENLGIFICMIGKTGDHTIMSTLEQHGVPFFNTWHSPTTLDMKLLRSNPQKIKILTGVREPLSFKISSFYEYIANLGNLNDMVLGNVSKEDFSCGGDAQKLIQAHISEEYQKIDYMKGFFSVFQQELLDLFVHPFNQEKGYTVIEEGNVEIFVYQLEKLNQIIPALSQWAGVPFQDLVEGYQAKEKWIADSYAQAKKELLFPASYLEYCYQLPYVRHFYSEADIEKFKEKWKNNIG